MQMDPLQSADLMLAALKKRLTKIPISDVVDIRYTPQDSKTSMALEALVASSEFTGQMPGSLIYVSGHSQQGILNLLDVPRTPSKVYPAHINVCGYYDRDPDTGRICAIYLPEDSLFSAAYRGSLDQLLVNPSIRLLEPSS